MRDPDCLPDGSLYGTTNFGGDYNNGTLFQITPSGKLGRVYSFTGSSDGANPEAPLILGPDGNFYGTTAFGGPDNAGTVFQYTPSGRLTTLYRFSGPDGASCEASLILGQDGTLYGTTLKGGTQQEGGTVFRLTLP